MFPARIAVEDQPLPAAAGEGPPGPPDHLRTLMAVLRWRAATTPNTRAFTFLPDGETEQATLSYADLDRRARAVGAELQARGAEGERVLLLFDAGLEFVAALYGCMYAGAVPVPVNPPDLLRLSRTLPRLKAVVEDAQARFILGSGNLVQAVDGAFCSVASMQMLSLESVSAQAAEHWRPRPEDRGDLALLQYTSGSTGTPRGILVSHGNLLASVACMHREDIDGVVGVTWLPPYHDFGLIAGVLLPVYSGRWTVLMPPMAFVERPLRWLRAISRYRGTTSGGPNFAYELCVRKARPEECEGLDLGCWKIAVVGAEPVRAETLERFVETFGPYGFRRETFLPAYGLAEAVLNVTSGRWFEPFVVRGFDRKALEEGRVEPCDEGDPRARRLVGCGRPWNGHRVAIVDPQTCRELAPGQVGEIWAQCPNVAQGYWNRPEETERVFRARLASDTVGQVSNLPPVSQPVGQVSNLPHEKTFLRTGDLGFIAEGELFVVARLKELIILGGRNYYPHDIEAVAARAHPALVPGQGAAFGCDLDGQERLVLVHEVRGGKRRDLGQVLEAVRNELVQEYMFSPHAIVLTPAGRLPKTSSGKPRRRVCREMFLADQLEVLAQWRAEPAGPDDRPEYEAPRTPLEEEIAAVWAQVLGVERVGIHDNFFALGGNSLLAAGLYLRLKEFVPVELELARLFERPTVAGLAELIVDSLLQGDGMGDLLDRLEAMPEEDAASLREGSGRVAAVR